MDRMQAGRAWQPLIDGGSIGRVQFEAKGWNDMIAAIYARKSTEQAGLAYEQRSRRPARSNTPASLGGST